MADVEIVAQIEEALFEGMKGDFDIASLVGANIFYATIPQDHMFEDGGAITFFRVTGGKVHSQGRDSGMADQLIQITAWGRTATETRDISTKIRLFLQDFTGDLGGTGVIVRGVILEDDGREDYDDTIKRYSRQSDYLIWHLEART